MRELLREPPLLLLVLFFPVNLALLYIFVMLLDHFLEAE